MKSSNLALVASCVVVSIATAAVVLALDNAGIISIGPAVEHVDEQPQSPSPPRIAEPVTAVPAPQPAERIAYLPRDVAVPPQSPPAQEELPAEEELPPEEPALSEETEGDFTGTWSAEVQQEEIEGSDEAPVSGETPRAPRRQAAPPRPTPQSAALTKRLAEISPGANARLVRKFEAAEAPWPPHEIALVAIKDEKFLELFARPENGEWKFIHRYPVLAASGGPGPKLRQGDKQVPEGIYGISFLNPNSRYHVSLRVNYPNAFDRQMAEAEGRTKLGGDIMIHGKAVSAGCLAVGDPAAEELFVLAANVGIENIKVIIAPTDFRRRDLPTVEAGQPKWLPKLYTEIAAAMSEFKSPPRISLLSFFGN